MRTKKNCLPITRPLDSISQLRVNVYSSSIVHGITTFLALRVRKPQVHLKVVAQAVIKNLF